VAKPDNWLVRIHPSEVPARYLHWSYSLALGWLGAALFVICCATGVLLAMHYRADATVAYGSILDIVSVVEYGRLLRSVHRFSGEAMIVCAALHLAWVFLRRDARGLRKWNWVVGVGLAVLILLTNFTGYLLPWDQTSYWGVTICASMLDYTPWVGTMAKQILLGGSAVADESLVRFYALHVVVLPAGLASLIVYHLYRFKRDAGSLGDAHGDDVAGQSRPTMAAALPTLYYWELASFFAALAVLIALGGYMDAPLAAPADVQQPPNPAKAPWYFLWVQELVSYSAVIGALVVPWLLLAGAVVMPWLPGLGRPARVAGRRARWCWNAAFLAVCAGVLVLTIVAACFRGQNWSWVVPWR
jgi:quinol-cytochrome oxidoreductase complex cytochrome b subunit